VQVYLNYAARENAADYLDAKKAEANLPHGGSAAAELPDAGEVHEGGEVGPDVGEVTGREHAEKEEGSRHADPGPLRNSPESGEGEPPKKRKKSAAPLMEADIDWGIGGAVSPQPDAADSMEGGSTVAEISGVAPGLDRTAVDKRKLGGLSKSARRTALGRVVLGLQPPGRDRELRGGGEGEDDLEGMPSSGAGLTPRWEEEGEPSAEGLMDYSPTRHGGESPPRREPAGHGARNLPQVGRYSVCLTDHASVN